MVNLSKIPLRWLYLVLIFSYVLPLNSQLSDTLNQYGASHHKKGYWIFYLDSNFRPSEKPAAKYYGFTSYCNNGQPREEPMGKLGLAYQIKYTPNRNVPERVIIPGLFPLNGRLSYESK